MKIKYKVYADNDLMSEAYTKEQLLQSIDYILTSYTGLFKALKIIEVKE